MAGQSYSYTVKARDAAGNLSGSSNAASVTVPQGTDTQLVHAGHGRVVRGRLEDLGVLLHDLGERIERLVAAPVEIGAGALEPGQI